MCLCWKNKENGCQQSFSMHGHKYSLSRSWVRGLNWNFVLHDTYVLIWASLGTDSKEPSCNAGFDPWVGKIPWRRKWQLTPVFLPGKSHGQRSLAGYSSWVVEESDTSEQLSTHIRTSYPAPASPCHPQVLVSYAGSRPLMTSRHHHLRCVCMLFLVSGFWGVPLFSCKFFKEDVLLSVCMHAC